MLSRWKVPPRVRLEASSVCQLRCALCPTASGEIRKSLVGAGLLTLESFRDFLSKNRSVKHIELSNWGEVFLNPEISEIMKLAYEQGIQLAAANGSNLDRVSQQTLEDLVRYRFRKINCSIDGASQQTYEKYRIGGNFSRIVANIQSINRSKKRFNSSYPILQWQFILFEHNKHELIAAHQMSRELGMEFKIKEPWSESLSPEPESPQSRGIEAHRGLMKWKSRREKRGKLVPTKRNACLQLWVNPQVNWDGKFLGCCANTWGEFRPNVFEAGLKTSMASAVLSTAKGMLMGRLAPSKEVPCASCHIYREMVDSNAFLRRTDVLKAVLRFRLAEPIYRRLNLDFLHHLFRLFVQNDNSIPLSYFKVRAVRPPSLRPRARLISILLRLGRLTCSPSLGM